ncbi:MAG: DNA-binding protein [Planctomycetota bacterium]|nr:MAG: DNA-binding protein [Planctomycetota bacterium]
MRERDHREGIAAPLELGPPLAAAKGLHEWACFCAHQAAEQAAKALYRRLHPEAWGHVVSDLLARLAEPLRSASRLIEREKELDRYCVSAHYPNGCESGASMDYYAAPDAERALGHAQAIIERCAHHPGTAP